jgi:hypothetical protein
MSLFLGIRRIATTVIGVLLLTQTASLTTVVPLTFDQLVQQADAVFIGEVVDVRSSWNETRDGRSIVTQVTFDVTRVLKGTRGLRTQLTFQGGRIGDVTQEVSGMPTFRIGDRDVLFVSPDRNAVSPIVGFWQGRFRIIRDAATGEAQVRSHDGSAIVDGFRGAGAFRGGASPARPMGLADFETLVKARVADRVTQQ